MNYLTAYQTLPWPARSLSNRACLQYVGRRLCIYQGMLMTCPDNWSKLGKKYCRRPSGYFITLCHVVWQFAFRLEQKYPGETSPNASTITRLVQRFRDTESVADRKHSEKECGICGDHFTKKSIEKTIRLHKHHLILAEQ
ncbi:hypothetical protein TNCV_4902851 [Trichonephila clavipes]|nr:hypothetical protein TNCV_4902851 [Trichonephila clavipes]